MTQVTPFQTHNQFLTTKPEKVKGDEVRRMIDMVPNGFTGDDALALEQFSRSLDGASKTVKRLKGDTVEIDPNATKTSQGLTKLTDAIQTANPSMADAAHVKMAHEVAADIASQGRVPSGGENTFFQYAGAAARRIGADDSFDKPTGGPAISAGQQSAEVELAKPVKVMESPEVFAAFSELRGTAGALGEEILLNLGKRV